MKQHVPAQKAFGLVIKKYRERLNLSKQQLAYESDLAVSTIKRLEYGQAGVSLHTLFTLADALQVSPTLLIKETVSRVKRSHENVR